MAKELSIKLMMPENVPRSLPLMNFLVAPSSEDVFVEVTPAIVVTNAGDDCDGGRLKRTTCVTAIRRGSVVGRNVVSLLISRPSEVAVKARQHVSYSTVSITGAVRWKMVYCHMQLCQPIVVLFDSFAGVHSFISCQLQKLCYPLISFELQAKVSQ